MSPPDKKQSEFQVRRRLLWSRLVSDDQTAFAECHLFICETLAKICESWSDKGARIEATLDHGERHNSWRNKQRSIEWKCSTNLVRRQGQDGIAPFTAFLPAPDASVRHPARSHRVLVKVEPLCAQRRKSPRGRN